MERSWYSVIDSGVGPLTVRWSRDALVGLYFDGSPALERRADWVLDDAALALARTQVEEYLRGERRVFDLPLAFQGTPFQERVWRALVDIPFGTTTTYGEIARRIGENDWAAARAVGAAAGQNPIAVIVPCHRVIGADGSLTGFGGGLPRKRWLLTHEGAPVMREAQAQLPLF